MIPYDLDQLNCFRAVVEHGSISRAARGLHLTQPAVSLKIRALESAFGAPLLVRSPRGVAPTAAGAILAESIPSLLAGLRSIEARVRQALWPNAGHVTFGSSDTAALYLLPAVIARFRARHARVALTLVNRESNELKRLCLEGQLDFALISLPHAAPRALITRVVSRPRLVAVGPRRHPQLKSGVIERACLAREPLVLLAHGSSTRTAIERYLEAIDEPRQVALESGNIEVIKRYVREGLGLSVLPQWTVSARERRQLQVAGLRPSPPSLTLALIHSAAKGLTPPASLLYQMVADGIGAMNGD